MKIFKIILELMRARAPKNQYYLNIGGYLLKKGSKYQIGQIVREKKLDGDKSRVNVITHIFFDFRTNKISHTLEKRVIKQNEKG